MIQQHLRRFASFAATALLLTNGQGSAWAADVFTPNNLVISRSVYTGDASTVTLMQTLPPGCVHGAVDVPEISPPATPGAFIVVTIPNNSSSGCNKAIADGTYPTVFNNDTVDGSFGVTSPIFLDQLTPFGGTISTLAIDSTRIVTSFSSKSELGLHKSLDGNSITFVGYVGGPANLVTMSGPFTTGPNQLDVSNSNTPAVIDITNPVSSQYYRSVAEVDALGNVNITNNNAYSGNNGREAIKADVNSYYMTGNDNNGGLKDTMALGNQFALTYDGVNLVHSTGVEFVVPGGPLTTPPNIAMVGTLTAFPADKPGKDTNFRGLTIHNNTLYFSKGSGSNGINTVYQVSPGTLPTPTTAGSITNLYNLPISIVPGFPTVPTSDATVRFPFDIWFADDTTMYVADEGDGTAGNAGTDRKSGLEKWIYDADTSTWNLAYTLQNGLNLGTYYSVTTPPLQTAYPMVAPDGVRHITGRVNTDGTVSIWGTTSTISTSGDQGADPNQLVYITDNLAANMLPANESFTLLRTAVWGEVLRGVSFAPGTASGVPASGNACNGVYNGDFTGNLSISAGQNCVFTGGTIDGNIQLNGGTLSLSNVALTGNVATSGGSISVGPSVSIKSNVALQNLSGASQVCQTSITGNVSIDNNAAAVTFGSASSICGGNSVGKNFSAQSNTGGLSVYDNTVGHSLACSANSTITGGGNTAVVKEGQCSAF